MNEQYLRPGFDFALAHLVEECGEVLAAAGKTQRWGSLSTNPELPPEQQETNQDWLMRELDDLEGAIKRLRAATTLPVPEDAGGTKEFQIEIKSFGLKE